MRGQMHPIYWGAYEIWEDWLRSLFLLWGSIGLGLTVCLPAPALTEFQSTLNQPEVDSAGSKLHLSIISSSDSELTIIAQARC